MWKIEDVAQGICENLYRCSIGHEANELTFKCARQYHTISLVTSVESAKKGVMQISWWQSTTLKIIIINVNVLVVKIGLFLSYIWEMLFITLLYRMSQKRLRGSLMFYLLEISRIYKLQNG